MKALVPFDTAAAVADAERDALRMADIVRTMLRRLRGLFEADDRKAIDAIKELDDQLDTLSERIERCLGMLMGTKQPKREIRRCTALLEFAGYVEHVADVVSRLLVKGASRQIQHGIRVSPGARASLEELLLLLQSHLQLCAVGFMHAGPGALRYLSKQRDALRRVERDIAREHFRQETAIQAGARPKSAPFTFALRCLRLINDRLAVLPGLSTRGWRPRLPDGISRGPRTI
ncbi:MAG: PhoU domain-containing protein [Gammaproteobacteria bacterium]